MVTFSVGFLYLVLPLAFRSWLYDLCRGIDDEPVKNRHLPLSIGCSKNFPGKTALATQKEVGEAHIWQKKKKKSLAF